VAGHPAASPRPRSPLARGARGGELSLPPAASPLRSRTVSSASCSNDPGRAPRFINPTRRSSPSSPSPRR
jgi:hypothetical protein